MLADAVGHPEWKRTERFKTPALRDTYANERLQMTQDALLHKSAEEWLDILGEAGVPCAPVLKRREVPHHPQVQASELIVEFDHPTAGRIRQTRPAARFSETAPEIRSGAPGYGEHNNEVLAEIGLSAEEQDALRAKGVIR
ncbi:MAG: CoA transferase [Gammaproteobacteria bacterium]|nr:CoA transferase [Gammaproteobacteria bacterium]